MKGCCLGLRAKSVGEVKFSERDFHLLSDRLLEECPGNVGVE